MPAATSCPSALELQRLVLGDLPGVQAEELREHLARCDRCLDTIQGLKAEDTLVGALRGGADEPADSGVIAPLVDQLCALHQQRTHSDPHPAPKDEPIDFLAPPQGPDELGRLGGYRILAVLGVGGMGVVFRAEDVRLRRAVALKVMKPSLATSTSARQRFLREAQAAAAVEHDHVVAIHQVDEDRGLPFLAMPLLRGVTLAQRLGQQPILPVAEVLRIGREIALGLAAAHGRGLIHRDVKPANVWLEGEPGGSATGGRVKILDFGLVRSVGDDAHLTQEGVIVGTPAYMAPEQAQGEGVDPRSDLFSLGCLLYRCCTGVLPFEGKDALSTLLAVKTERPRSPRAVNPDVPAALSELILRLLAKDPAARPASAQEVVERLQALERQPAVPVGQDLVPGGAAKGQERNPDPRPRALARRRNLIVAAAVLLALVPLAWLYGGTLLRLATNKGELVIEADDPNIEVTVKDGNATVYDKVKDRRFVLTPGDYEVEVREEGDGGVRFTTKKFTITRGGKEMLNAHLELAKVKPQEGGGDERKAAEWVLSLGGTVWVRTNSKDQEITTARDLPTEAFQLLSIHIPTNRLLREEGLVHVKGLPNLVNLVIGSNRVTNAGLEHLRGLSSLTNLSLDNTGVTDAGLVHLTNLTNLTYLQLAATPAGDAGLDHLKPLTKLTILGLNNTRVTDAGLKSLYSLTELQKLELTDTKVTAAGVAALQKALPQCKILYGPEATAEDCQAAQWVLALGGTVGVRVGGGEQHFTAAKDLPDGLCPLVSINSTGKRQVTDSGLQRLQGLKNLTSLNLAGTSVTDAGLMHLAGLTSLTSLDLSGTEVTGTGLEHLKPLTKLTGLNLSNTRITDAGVKKLAGLKNLQTLRLTVTADTEEWLKELAGLESLRSLSFASMKVTGQGLKQLASCKSLEALNFLGDHLTDADLKGLADIKGLRELDLWGPELTDGGLKELNGLTSLRSLRLWAVPVTDAGVVHLHGMSNLQSLYLNQTNVTAAGVAALKEALPQCQVAADPAPAAVPQAGPPLSPRALVSRPAVIPGVRSWSLETTWSQQVHHMAFSPAGDVVATAGKDGSVRLYSADGTKLVKMLLGHAAAVKAVAWSPDGKTLASSGTDQAIRLWDAATGRLVRTLPGYKDDYHLGLAWSPDGKTLASLARDQKRIDLWDMTGDRPPVTIRGEMNAWALAWSPDSKLLVNSVENGQEAVLQFRDGKTGQVLRTSEKAGRSLVDVAWSPDGKTFATAHCYIDPGLFLWDAATGKMIRTLKEEQTRYGMWNAVWLDDGNTVVSIGGDRIQYWDTGTGKLVKGFGHGFVTGGGTCSRDGKHFASWVADANGGSAAFFSPQATPAGDIKAETTKRLYYWPWWYAGSTLDWSPNGMSLASHTAAGQIYLWNVQQGSPSRTWPLRRHLVKVGWSADGIEVLACSWDQIARWNPVPPQGQLLSSFKLDNDLNNTVHSISPDRSRVAVANETESKRVFLYDLNTGKRLHVLEEKVASFVYGGPAISWSPDGKWLAVALANGTVRLWDTASGKPVRDLDQGHTKVVRTMAWSHDGKLLATAGDDDFMLLWDPATGLAARSLQDGHQGTVRSLAWSPDDKTLYSGGDDRTVRVWRVETGKQLEVLDEQQTSATTLALSPDGKTLAVLNADDARIQVWDLPTRRLLGRLLMLPDGHYLAVSPDGHYRGSPRIDQNLVYVVETEKGQETLTPAEFAEKYGWKNDPDKMRLVGLAKP